MTKHNLDAHLAWLLHRPCPIEHQFQEFSHSTSTGSTEDTRTDAVPNLENFIDQIQGEPAHSPTATNSNGVISPTSNRMPRLELASPARPRIQMRSLTTVEENIKPTPRDRKRDRLPEPVELSASKSKTPRTKSKSCEEVVLPSYFANSFGS